MNKLIKKIPQTTEQSPVFHGLKFSSQNLNLNRTNVSFTYRFRIPRSCEDLPGSLDNVNQFCRWRILHHCCCIRLRKTMKLIMQGKTYYHVSKLCQQQEISPDISVLKLRPYFKTVKTNKYRIIHYTTSL